MPRVVRYSVRSDGEVVDRRDDVKEDEEDIQYQSGVSIILIPKFLNERDGFDGKD